MTGSAAGEPGSGRQPAAPSTAARTSGVAGLQPERVRNWFDDNVLDPLLRAHAARVLLAGGVAGMVSRTAVAPLERTKLLFQVQGLSVSPPGQPLRYTSVWQSLSAILQKEGIRGWYKGNVANCVRIIPMSALQFYGFDVLKRKLLAENGAEALTPLQRLWAGALAGAFAQTLTYPLDFMRARLTVDMEGRYRGLFSGMAVVVREEGVLQLYRGLVPSLAGIMPYVGVDFMVYGTLREWLPRHPDTGEPSVVGKLAVGALAGAAGQTVAYPLDTVRCARARARVLARRPSAPPCATARDRRMPPPCAPPPSVRRRRRRRQLQVQSFKVKYPDVPKYRGMVDCFRGILQRDGWRGLFRGLSANYLKVAPSISIQFVMFETCCKYFEEVHADVRGRRDARTARF